MVNIFFLLFSISLIIEIIIIEELIVNFNYFQIPQDFKNIIINNNIFKILL